MIIVLGATGHIGSATAETLLKQGEAVTVVTRAADRAEHLRKLGAEIAVDGGALPEENSTAAARTTNARRLPKTSDGAISSGRTTGGVGQANRMSGVPP